MSVGQIVDNPKTNNASPIRILAIDDHQLIRVGIATLIAPESDMTLVGEAVNGIEGIAKYRECLPDVTLMDLRMPDMEGIDAIIAIRSEYPEARIIVLTTYTGDVQAFRAMQAGAQAYVTKNLVHQELLQTIRAVHAGRRAMSPEVAAEVAAYAGDQTLTVREIDVLRLIAAGCANKEIAAQLSITEDTVKSRVKNILLKLGANDRTHAVTIGLRRGIIAL
jgi:DNA-binding NarL/FixJ family response regulator